MEIRGLGSTDLRVSVLGFGCAPIGSRSGAAQSTRALRAAFDSGITYFDTADMYGLGDSEKLIARVFGSQRDKILIATKCGYTFSRRLRAVNMIKPLLRPLVTKLKRVKASAASVMTSQRSQCFDVPYIESCVHDSLTRLGADRIDLFFLHDPPASIADRPEVFEKLRALRQAGKIRWFGVSCNVDAAERILQTKDTGVAALQITVNPIEADALATVIPEARAKGIGIIARQPFANGRIFSSEAALGALASRGLASDPESIASLALRFVREIDGVASILPSMMRPEHLASNLRAIEAGPLTGEERDALAAIGSAAPGN